MGCKALAGRKQMALGFTLFLYERRWSYDRLRNVVYSHYDYHACDLSNEPLQER